MGVDVDEVTDSLLGLIDAIRPSRMITMGQSMGAYAAIMHGMLLGADQIVAFGPLSHLDPIMRDAIRGLWLPLGDAGIASDRPRCFYKTSSSSVREVDYRGELHVIFGTHPRHDDGVSSNFDAVHALRLAQLPNTILDPHPQADHGIVSWLVDNGKWTTFSPDC